jgi:hypothetical protein
MIKHDGRRSFHLREEFKKMRAEQRDARMKAGIDMLYPDDDLGWYGSDRRAARRRAKEVKDDISRGLEEPNSAVGARVGATDMDMNESAFGYPYEPDYGRDWEGPTPYELETSRDSKDRWDVVEGKESIKGSLSGFNHEDPARLQAIKEDLLTKMKALEEPGYDDGESPLERELTRAALTAKLNMLNQALSVIEYQGRGSGEPRFKKNLEEGQEGDTPSKAPSKLKATIRYFPDSGHTKIYYQNGNGQIKHISRIDNWTVKELGSSEPHRYKVIYSRNGQKRSCAFPVDEFERVGFEDD